MNAVKASIPQLGHCRHYNISGNLFDLFDLFFSQRVKMTIARVVNAIHTEASVAVLKATAKGGSFELLSVFVRHIASLLETNAAARKPSNQRIDKHGSSLFSFLFTWRDIEQVSEESQHDYTYLLNLVKLYYV